MYPKEKPWTGLGILENTLLTIPSLPPSTLFLPKVGEGAYDTEVEVMTDSVEEEEVVCVTVDDDTRREALAAGEGSCVREEEGEEAAEEEV